MKLDAQTISSGKDLVALLRDLLLFAIGVLLLIFPGTFNSVLVKAGFEEGSFAGIKWKKKAIDFNDELKVVNENIKNLKAQLNSANKLLNQARAKVSDSTLKKNITKLEEKNDALIKITTSVQNSVSNTLAANKSLIQRAEADIGTNTKWGIVFSGDKTLPEAKYETDVIAKKLGIPNTSIFFRQGSYRSVSIVDNRDEADNVLLKAKKRRSDAYIVRIEKWCPDYNEKDGYFECSIK